MKRVYVADIRPGDEIDDCFRVVECRLMPYRDPRQGHYLRLVLADRSGQAEARLWEGAEEAARWLSPGDIVRVRARAALYRDHIRLRLQDLEPAAEQEPELLPYLPAPPPAVDDLLAAVHKAIQQVLDQPLRSLLESFFGDNEFVEAFTRAPARQPGELLTRTVQLLELAEPLSRVVPQLDVDLLTAGILLCRIGEIKSLEGSLGVRALAQLGATVLSDQLVTERLAQMPEFPAHRALALRHLIHSADQPARAQTREAAVLASLRALQAVLRR